MDNRVETDTDDLATRVRPALGSSGGPAQPAQPAFRAGRGSEAPPLKEYLAILRRRRSIALYSFTLITVLGVVYTLMQPAIYATSSKLLVESQSNVLNAVDASNPLSVLFASDQKQAVETQVQMLQSVRLIGEVRKQIGSKAPFSLNVRQVGKTNVIAISAESTDPKVAADAPRLLMSTFLAQDKEGSLLTLQDALKFIQQQQQIARDKLNHAENALRSFKQETKVTELEQNRSTQLARVTALQDKLKDTQRLQKNLDVRISSIEGQLGTVPGATETVLSTPNTAYAALKQRRESLVARRQELLARYTEKNPSVIAVESQIRDVNKDLSATPEFVKTPQSAVNPVRNTLQSQLSDLQIQLAAANAEQKLVSQDLTEAQANLSRYPTYETMSAQLKRDYEMAAEQERMLSTKRVDVELRVKGFKPGASVLEPPAIPTTPVRPRRAQNVIVFALFGIFVGVSLGLMQEYLDDRINSLDDSDRILGLPSLGAVPALSEGDSQLLPLVQKINPAKESYRVLRTNIHFASIDDPVRTLLVSSAGPGEGKTTTSINLAFAMAADGKKVILVDTDLRRPSLHKRLRVSNTPGLTDVLLDQARLEDVLTPLDDEPNLSIITAGSPPPNPSELIGSRKFRTLVTQLSEWADLVIFDSSPILVAADSAILASTLDSALLVVEAGSTRKSSARAALAHLEQARARVLGVVHNKLREHDSSAYYYYGYSYHYQYQYQASPEEVQAAQANQAGTEGLVEGGERKKSSTGSALSRTRRDSKNGSGDH